MGKTFTKTSFILEKKKKICFSLKSDTIYNHSQNNLNISISAPFRNASAYKFCHRAVKRNPPPPYGQLTSARYVTRLNVVSEKESCRYRHTTLIQLAQSLEYVCVLYKLIMCARLTSVGHFSSAQT